jgi:hypothetical protein
MLAREFTSLFAGVRITRMSSCCVTLSCVRGLLLKRPIASADKYVPGLLQQVNAQAAAASAYPGQFTVHASLQRPPTRSIMTGQLLPDFSTSAVSQTFSNPAHSSNSHVPNISSHTPHIKLYNHKPYFKGPLMP